MIAAVSEAVVTTILLFFSYSYLVRMVGIGELGIWSLVVGVVAFSQGADLGFSKSITQFVALSRAKQDYGSLIGYIATAFSTVLVFVLAAAGILYWPLTLLILFLLDFEAANVALSLLPLSLVYLVISRAALVTLSALQGLQQTSTKSSIMTIGVIFQVALMMVLVPTYGIVGMVYSQIGQAILNQTLSIAALFYHLPKAPIRSLRWTRERFGEIFSFGMRSQFISWLTICLEPVTKMLISQFGNVEVLGVFEIANRLVAQTTKLIAAANEVLFPAIADLRITSPDQVSIVYGKALGATSIVALLVFPALVSCVPVLGAVIVGRESNTLILMVTILACGRFMNVLSAPAYFLGFGLGNLKPNIIGHLAIAVLNVTLGPVFGFFWGGIGITVAAAVAVFTGSYYMRRENEKMIVVDGSSKDVVGRSEVFTAGLLVLIWLGSVEIVLKEVSFVASIITFVVVGLLYISVMCTLFSSVRSTVAQVFQRFRRLKGLR